VSRLYIFGDSYSTPYYCVEPQQSWWGLIAKQLGLPVSNYSWPGNNIDSIQHIIVSNQDQFNKDDFVIIGIPPVERQTIFKKDAAPKSVTHFNKDVVQTHISDVLSHQGLDQCTMHEMGKDIVNVYNVSWQEAKILKDIIMLSHWLDSVVDKHLIVNLSVPFQQPTEWPTLKHLQDQARKNKNIKVFADTYYSVNHSVNKPVDYDTHGWFGHHGAEGNALWYNSVLRTMI
jgi:hypothetical protein